MAFLISVLALLCWAALAVLVVVTVRTRALGRVRLVALFCILVYQIWFYFPRTNLFPAADYAPIDSVHIVNPAKESGMLEPTEAQSTEILAICNRLSASRSALRTFIGRAGGADLYVYFSGRAWDGSRTNLLCGSRSRIKLHDQYYHIWNADGMTEQIRHALGLG